MKLLLRFPDLAFHKINDPLRLRDRVIFRHRADNNVAIIVKNNRGRDALAFRVRNDLRLTVGIDMSDRREGRPEVNSDCFSMRHRRVMKRVLENAPPALPCKCRFHAEERRELHPLALSKNA